MKNVLISNQTEKNIHVRILQDSTNELALDQNSEVNFDLTKSGDNSSLQIIYGLGAFSIEELESFQLMIKQIQVRTEKDTCQFEGKELHELMPKHRKRLFKNQLEISIKNCSE